MKPSDFPWKLNQSKTLNGYTFHIESADGLTIGELYGSTNPMWDFVPGAMQALENARFVVDSSKRIAELEKQRDELLAAMIHIQQVACSGSPELGIAIDAIASVKGKQ